VGDKQHLQNYFCCQCIYCMTCECFFFAGIMLVLFLASFKQESAPGAQITPPFHARVFSGCSSHGWFEIGALQGHQDVPLAKAEAQTPLCSPLSCHMLKYDFRIKFTGQEVLPCVMRESAKLAAGLLVTCGY